MYLPQIPNDISWESVAEALESLGITTTKLCELKIVPGSIELTYFRTTSENVDQIAMGSSTRLSQVKTTIRIRRAGETSRSPECPGYVPLPTSDSVSP